MRIKTTRYCYTPIRMAKIQNTDNTKCWQGCGATGTLIHCCGEYKMIQPLWKTVWQFIAKVNMLLPYDLAIMLLGIPKRAENLCHTKICKTNVYSSFIHNCQNLEATKISFSKGMEK